MIYKEKKTKKCFQTKNNCIFLRMIKNKAKIIFKKYFKI